MNYSKMKKVLRYSFLILIVVSLTGCSWITRFAVRNASNNPITVIYALATNNHQETKNISCPINNENKWLLPEITKDYLWWFNAGNWVELSEDNYIIDSQECSVELTLNPGESVRVTRKGTYTGHQDKSGKKKLELSYLIIRTKDGEIMLKGWELLKRFEKVKDNLYIYNYE